MSETILIGHGSEFSTMKRSDWEAEIWAAPRLIKKRLAFMSSEHHAVRNFVVRELPRFGRPISVSHIADALRLARQRVEHIVDDLERNRFFLVRRNGPDVTWAFPVTVEPTEHHLVFSTGERLNAA